MSLPETAARPRRHIPVVATIVVVVLGLLVASFGVNNIPTYEETSKARWSEVQSQYQRRAELIPNLVETVKGFAKQERDNTELRTFPGVIWAKTLYASSRPMAEFTVAEDVPRNPQVKF